MNFYLLYISKVCHQIVFCHINLKRPWKQSFIFNCLIPRCNIVTIILLHTWREKIEYYSRFHLFVSIQEMKIFFQRNQIIFKEKSYDHWTQPQQISVWLILDRQKLGLTKTRPNKKRWYQLSYYVFIYLCNGTKLDLGDPMFRFLNQAVFHLGNIY